MTLATPTLTKVPNFVNGRWTDSSATEWIDVTNPATGEVIAQTRWQRCRSRCAVEAAAAAFPEWRRTPPEDRIQPLFKLKHILEDQIGDLAASSLRRTARHSAKPKPSTPRH